MSKVPAADATLAVLTYLASQTRPVAASRISAELGLPRSTTYDLLGALVEHGFAIHYTAERAYGLGAAAYELSAAYQRSAPLAILGRRITDRLAREVGESAHLAVLHARDVLYVVESRAPGRPSLVTDVGVRLPAHLTATGRALLAALPEAQLRALYKGIRELEVRHSTTGLGWTAARVMAEAKQTRQRGHAVEDGEITPGMASTAVAVEGRSGWPLAAVAVTFASGRNVDALPALRRAAGALERSLG